MFVLQNRQFLGINQTDPKREVVNQLFFKYMNSVEVGKVSGTDFHFPIIFTPFNPSFPLLHIDFHQCSYFLPMISPTFPLVLTLLLLHFTQSASPMQVSSFKISSFFLPNLKVPMELQVSAPVSHGLYPCLLFLTGFEGLTPGSAYSEFARLIASQGFVFVTLSKLANPQPQKVAKTVEKVIKWMDTNFNSRLNALLPGVSANLNQGLIIAGHSAGGHVITQYLNQTCGTVKAQILIDPVDGADPYGFINNYIISPGEYLPYATPVLVIGSELDPVKVSPVQPPCAPNNISNLRFYDAMRGPKWFFNISKYGHMDFVDSSARMLSSTLCPVCRKDCDFVSYRSFLKDIVVNFSLAILKQDRTRLQWIEAGELQIPSETTHQYMGFNPLGGGFCIRVPGETENQFIEE